MATINATAGEETTTFDVEDGTRLVLALEDNGVDILHRCGGWAKCTTCAVTFDGGAQAEMNAAEKELAEARDLGDRRLSCQMVAEGDMSLTVHMTVSSTDFDEPGNAPEPNVTP